MPVVDQSPLPSTVAPSWRPRSEEWSRRAPSRYDGRPNRPLFIGGCPRSGTTLLQVMLDMHPEMGMPRETNFIREMWWRRRHFGDLRDPANRQRVAEWIFSDPSHLTRRLTHKRLGRKKAIREIGGSHPTIGSIVERCIRLHAHDTPRWGDKRPAYSGFIGPLLRMFPDAQYINVVRDPRGVAASQLAMGWDRPKAVVPAAVIRWEFAAARTDHYAARLRPDQLLDVRYEDLVAEPHRELERILRFAGLQSSPDIVDRLVSGERQGWFVGPHELVAAPVSTTPVSRWRTRLSPAQVALIEQETATLMERCGYLPTDEAHPLEEELRVLERRRRAFQRRWRRTRRDERLRDLRYRRPVVAAGHE